MQRPSLFKETNNQTDNHTTHHHAIDAIVIGASAGGMQLLLTMLPQLPATLPVPIFLVTHQKATGKHHLCSILKACCPLHVKEAEDKMRIEAGHLYIAPANYHLLIESPHQIALSMDEAVHFCRPSVDILFESAADIFQSRLLGIILTGMGRDGADGLLAIHQTGGICAVQDPKTAAFASMPEAAQKNVPNAQTFSPNNFGTWLMTQLAHHQLTHPFP